MHHIIFLFLFITMMFIGSWTVVAILLYINTRKSILAWEALVGMSLMMITAGLLIKNYSSNCGLDVHQLPTYISFAGTFACLFSLTFFTHALSGVPITRLRRSIFIGIAVVFSTVLLFMPELEQFDISGPFAARIPASLTGVALIIYAILFYATLGYCFVAGLIAGNRIGDPVLKKMYTTTFGTCLAGMLPLIFFSISGSVNATSICLCGMFSSLSIENLYFSFFFSNQPVYFRNDGLTSIFISRFQISDREQQITRLLLEGKSNKDMADTLFISPRTVENHLSSIYQKTSVSSRVQLINLIRANTGK